MKYLLACNENTFLPKALLLPLSLLVFLGGCASMGEEECLNADWRMIGVEDGSFGRPLTTLASHRKACAKVNITPNQTAYEQGHYEGLVRYCSYRNGLILGEKGGVASVECPLEARSEFDRGYSLGKEIYSARTKIADLESAIVETKEKLQSLDDDISAKEELLVQGEGDAVSRRAALDGIRQLRVDAELVRLELHNQENELSWAQDRLESLKNHSR